MDVHEAAELLHYSERHIKRLAREGKLPATIVARQRVVIVKEYEFPDNLLQWVESGGYIPYTSRRRGRVEKNVSEGRMSMDRCSNLKVA